MPAESTSADEKIGLSDAEVNRIFRALADATRRDLLSRSLTHEASVSELALAYEMSFAAVQKHISILEKAELVTKHQQGRERRIRGNPATIRRARALLDAYGEIWQARTERLETLLIQDKDPHPRKT